MRNNGWCGWSLSGSKSSAHDTEARIRKFAEHKILASPSLSKMLFPTSTIAKDCRRVMVTLPLRILDSKILTLNRPIEVRPSHVKSLFFGGSFGGSRGVENSDLYGRVGLSALKRNVSGSKFRKSRRCSRDDFMNVRFEFPLSLYTFGYRRAGWVPRPSFIIGGAVDTVRNRADQQWFAADSRRSRIVMIVAIDLPRCGLDCRSHLWI